MPPNELAGNMKHDLPIEPWRYVWRNGVAAAANLKQLEVLRDALVSDDPRLIQASTVEPSASAYVSDWTCEGACAVAFMQWKGSDCDGTVGDVTRLFAQMCFLSDTLLGMRGVVRHFLNWFDDTDRQEVRQLLLPEVERSIQLKLDEAKLLA